jgi:hypothetical protein
MDSILVGNNDARIIISVAVVSDFSSQIKGYFYCKSMSTLNNLTQQQQTTTTFIHSTMSAQCDYYSIYIANVVNVHINRVSVCCYLAAILIDWQSVVSTTIKEVAHTRQGRHRNHHTDENTHTNKTQSYMH